MKTRLDRDAVIPEKEYVTDYVHQVCEPGGELVFPLRGAKPLVSVGEEVRTGQPLGRNTNGRPCAHSSASGTVKTIERRNDGRGETMCIVVDNDRKFLPVQPPESISDWQELGRQELLNKILDGGAVGIHPRRCPTAARLEELGSEDVARVIVDGTEWEPYVSSDDDTLRTHSFGVVTGLRILLRLFPGAEGLILIGDDKQSALNYILDAARDAGGISVVSTPAGRPLGDEQMIAQLFSGGERAHTVVVTPTEANAVCEAVCSGIPLMRRVVTVAGSAVKNPGNYLVRVGMSCAELLAAAGGLRPGTTAEKAVLGGAMTGLSLTSLEVPVQKDTAALLLFESSGEEAETACIRCGRCARVCPAGLMPMLLTQAAERGDPARFDSLRGQKCVECGACTWICPAKRPLARSIRYALTLAGR